MSNVKYLSYEGLTHYTENLFKVIEENEEVVASALTDLNTKLDTHTHTQYAPTSHTHTYVASAGYSASAARASYAATSSYSASAGYIATAANAVTAGRAFYSGSAGYSASAARAGYAAYAGYVSNSLTIAGISYNGSKAQTITINTLGGAAADHSHTYVASAGYSASAARATYAATSSYSASAGYSASAARATYSASAGYVYRVNLMGSNSGVYYPMVFTSARTATVGALLYIDSGVTDTTSTATGIRYNPSTNSCYCSGGFYEASDARLKNFGNDIEVDLDKLSILSKKYFTWKDDKSNVQHIGVSAQELQELYPEIVNVIDEDGHLSVSYDKLSVVALKGIDVLNDKITSLEKRLDKLEGKLNIAQ